jgi:hypothetical protein
MTGRHNLQNIPGISLDATADAAVIVGSAKATLDRFVLPFGDSLTPGAAAAVDDWEDDEESLDFSSFVSSTESDDAFRLEMPGSSILLVV